MTTTEPKSIKELLASANRDDTAIAEAVSAWEDAVDELCAARDAVAVAVAVDFVSESFVKVTAARVGLERLLLETGKISSRSVTK